MGSGSVSTQLHCHQRQVFHYSYKINKDKRRFEVSWYVSTNCDDAHRSPTYYLWSGSSHLNVNGKKYSWGSSYSSGGHTVYRGFADNGSYLDNNYRNKVFHDLNGDYIGINRYVKVLGTKWVSGSFNLDANNEGKAHFSVSGSFTWYGATKTFSKTFTLSSDDLIAERTISYDDNNDTFYKKTSNKCHNIPDKQPCKYGSNKVLSSKVPTVTNDNYVFVSWNTKKDGTGTNYNPGSTIKNIKNDIKLYAQWREAQRKITVKLGLGKWVTNSGKRTNWEIGSGHNSVIISGKYGEIVYLPNNNNVNLIGRYISKYTNTNDNITVKVSKDTNQLPEYRLEDNLTLSTDYEYYTYNIRLYKTTPPYKSSTPGATLLGTIPAQYNHIIKGNFSLSKDLIPAGYEHIGWSFNKGVILNPNDDGSKNCYIRTKPDLSKVNFIHDHGISLYPVYRYLTSFYVYTDNGWKLALPYIYSDGKWQMALGQVFDSSTWKK